MNRITNSQKTALYQQFTHLDKSQTFVENFLCNDVNYHYHGSFDSYEDPADYTRTGSIKAVRLG